MCQQECPKGNAGSPHVQDPGHAVLGLSQCVVGCIGGAGYGLISACQEVWASGGRDLAPTSRWVPRVMPLAPWVLSLSGAPRVLVGTDIEW